MRIAFYSDIFYPEISGIADSIIATGRELAQRGHDIGYFVSEYSKKDYKLAGSSHSSESAPPDVDWDFTAHRLPAVGAPGSPTGQWRLVAPFGASLPHLRKFKPDIIHTQTPFGAGFEALLASSVLDVPLIGTNHTPIEEFVGYVPLLGRRLSKVAGRYSAWYYNRCAYVTAPNDRLIEDMRRMRFVRPARAVANPVRLGAFKPACAERKREIRKALGLSGPVVMYAGRLAAEKHVDVVLRAIARLPPQVPATLIATGHGQAEKSLRALAIDLKLGARAQFTGFVSLERLAEFYQAADVFVMMSTAETQSLALMQAFASGLPAVVARAQGLPEHVSAACCFLVEPGDETALAERLGQLLADEKLRVSMGASAVEFARRYAPALIAEQWEHIYRRHATEHC
ncbi:glycosyltransferase [Methylocapsa acidiphila]|uniref:glycosyltransferase n=1 Tax=Methylocapsa acidiphila TaxID=133552 RepID=UPI000408DD59|nr:glycosyltransferase [Methylocapsa acidiphila]